MPADIPSSDLPPDPQRDTLRELFEGVYSIHERLSWGGLGLVFRATEPGREVALTVLPVDCGTAERALAFEAFAATLGGLSHPGLMAPTDFGVEQGVPFVEYELLKARTLRERMAEAKLPIHRALSITRQVAAAVDAAHRADLSHHDLTPNTVLIEEGAEGDVARVFGVGIAAAIAGVRENNMTGPTGRGSGPQAARFIAPEVRLGGHGDGRSDVYSLGALLAFMLAGEAPPLEGTPELDAPLEIGFAVSRAMSLDPVDRPPNVEAFLALLEAESESPLAPADTEPTEADSTPKAGVVSEPSSSEPRGSSISKAAILFLIASLAAGGFYAYSIFIDRQEITTTEPTAGPFPPPADLQDPEPAPERAPEPEPEPDRTPPSIPGPLAEIPVELAPYLARLDTGEELSEADFNQLFGYATRHPTDARVHLVMARGYVQQQWLTAAAQRYNAAIQLDTESCADPLMLDHLIRVAANPEGEPKVNRAFRICYGASATSRVETAAEAESRPAFKRRLEVFARRISRMPSVERHPVSTIR